jgi:hypothetical protein
MGLLEAAGVDTSLAGDETGLLIANSAAEWRGLPERLTQALAQHRFFGRFSRATVAASR